MSPEEGHTKSDSATSSERKLQIWSGDRRPATPPEAAPPVEEAAFDPASIIRRALKAVGCIVGLTLAFLPAMASNLEAALTQRQGVFVFWGQLFALIPGLAGKYVRKCYYFLTLPSCTLDWEIGFLSYFTDRRADVGQRVYIGVGSYLASVTIGDGCLIGSRASIVGGKHQHRFGPDGRLTPFDPAGAQQIRIGAETWIGEGAILMADVGSRCIVAAGCVVVNPVPDGCVVGGNPARIVGKTGSWEDGR